MDWRWRLPERRLLERNAGRKMADKCEMKRMVLNAAFRRTP
jgi:hypothetical protein